VSIPVARSRTLNAVPVASGKASFVPSGDGAPCWVSFSTASVCGSIRYMPGAFAQPSSGLPFTDT
jgi:hypothetical protein